MQTYLDPDGKRRPDRRRHHKLRDIYDDARSKVERFFHMRHEWAGSSIDYLALRLVHETYPDLDSHEVRTLVAAIERAFQAPDTSPSPSVQT